MLWLALRFTQDGNLQSSRHFLLRLDLQSSRQAAGFQIRQEQRKSRREQRRCPAPWPGQEAGRFTICPVLQVAEHRPGTGRASSPRHASPLRGAATFWPQLGFACLLRLDLLSSRLLCSGWPFVSLRMAICNPAVKPPDYKSGGSERNPANCRTQRNPALLLRLSGLFLLR